MTVSTDYCDSDVTKKNKDGPLFISVQPAIVCEYHYRSSTSIALCDSSRFRLLLQMTCNRVSTTACWVVRAMVLLGIDHIRQRLLDDPTSFMLCLHDMIVDIWVDLSGLHSTNLRVQQWLCNLDVILLFIYIN